MASAILAISTALQFVAAFMAVRLVKVTRSRAAWISIAAAILLMALRRTITLAHIAYGDLTLTIDPQAEAVALLVSVLMVVGVSRIGPLFSELQRSAAEVSKSQRHLQDILDHIPAAVYVKDLEGRTILINKYVSEHFSTSLDATGITTCFDSFPNDIAELTRKNDLRVVDAGQPIEFHECLPHADGSSHHYLSTKFPLSDVNGNVYAICGISNDITERIDLEQERREFEAQLQEAQRLESLGSLAGGVAHDFNNLLVAILGSIDLARTHAAVPAEVKDDLSRAITASQAAAALCNQLLVYAGKASFQMTSVSLSEVIDELSRLFEVFTSKRGKVELHLDSDLPAIEGDKSQLQQVVMNLVTNASDALTASSGKVTVSTTSVTIGPQGLPNLRAGDELSPGQYVCLEVRDTGAGMTEETRRRLFEPFYTTKFTGRGLGLAAVAGVVRSHRGAISLQSEQGEGSIFRVYFPVSTAATMPRTKAKEAVSVSAARGTILVVDDEPMIRELTMKVLQRAGFEVRTAENGQQAVELFAANPAAYAVVVVDLLMPVMDGYQTFVELRRIDCNARVLLSSGFDADSMDRRRLAEGFTGFIQKPYRAQDLVDAVRHAID